MNIRQAKAEDASFLSWAILTGSRGEGDIGLFDKFFDGMSEKDILKKLESLVQSSEMTMCHYKNFLVAEEGNKIIGALCGYEPRKYNYEGLFTQLAVLGVEDGKDKMQSYRLCDKDLDKNTWMIDFVAMKAGFSLDILKVLIQKNLLTARLKGYRRTQTKVFLSDLTRKMAFEKVGYSTSEENKHDQFELDYNHAGLCILGFDL